MDHYSESDYALYRYLMHSTFTINTVSTTFAVYLLLRHTPSSLKVYRWFLLNISLCAYWLDTWLTLAYVPFPMLPVIGTCALGLLSAHQPYGTVIGWAGFQLAMGACAMSVTWAIVYRACAVFGHKGAEMMATRPRIIFIMGLLQLFYALPPTIMAPLTTDTREMDIAFLNQTHPAMLDFYLAHSCHLKSARHSSVSANASLLAYMALCLLLILVLVTLNGALISTILYGLRKMDGQAKMMTEKTYRMQRQLTISLLLQYAIPCSMLGCSYIVFIILLGMELYGAAEGASLCSFVVASLHSTVNSIVIIAGIKPYRKCVLKTLKIGIKKTKTIFTKTH